MASERERQLEAINKSLEKVVAGFKDMNKALDKLNTTLQRLATTPVVEEMPTTQGQED